MIENNKKGFLFVDGAIVLPLIIMMIISMILLAVSLYEQLAAQTMEHIKNRTDHPSVAGKFIMNIDFLGDNLKQDD